MSTIGIAPVNFSLSTYNTTRVSGVNNGSSVNLSTYLGSGKRIVIFFVNIASAGSACEWLEILRTLEDADTQPIAVCFNHDGTGYLGALGVSVTNITNVIEYGCTTDVERDAAHADFYSIPVLRDPNGTFSNDFLDGIVNDAGLYGRPAGSTKLFANLPAGFAYGMWAYIIGPDDAIRDKWHNEWASDPLSLVHLLNAGAGEVFPVGAVTDWTIAEKDLLSSLISDRCANLGSSLEKLSVNPDTEGYLTAFPASITIAFSRPLDAAQAGTLSTWVLGGPAVSAGAGNATSADYTGRNFIENTVALAYAGASLDDSGGWDMTISFPSIRDSAGGMPAAGHDGITWDVSTSVPSATGAAFYGVDGAGGRHAALGGTVGYGRIEVDLTFNEPLPDQANPVTVTDLGTNAAQNIGFAINTSDRTRAVLSFSAADPGLDGEWGISIAADELTDGAGVTGPAAAWSGGAVVYDAAPPKPVATIHLVDSDNNNISPIGDPVVRHKVRFAVDFQEAVSGWDAGDITGNFVIVGGGTVTYHGAGATPGSYFYDWLLSGPGAKSLSVKASAAQDSPLGRNTPASDAYTFTYAPTYTDIVVVVDKSGSMGWKIPYNPGTGLVDTPKWTVMEPGIEEFLAELRGCIVAGTVHGTEDRLALITYDSTARSVPIAGSAWETAGDVGDSDTPGPFEAALRFLAPGGNTAMASAIGEAYAMLDARPSGRGKAVILFADGQRNAGASLTIVDGNQASDYFRIGAPYNRTVTRDPASHYPIYAAGIHTELASAAQWLADLQSIADISGGLYMDIVEVDPFDDVTIAFASFFDAIYGGHSPVTVSRLSGTIPPGHASAEVDFRLDHGVAGLVAAAAWPGAAGLGLRLYRDGVSIATPDSSVKGPHHRIDTLVFPHVQYAPRSPASGPAAAWKPPIRLRPIRRVEICAEGAWKAQVFRQGNSDAPLPFVLKIVAEQDGPEPQVLLPGPPYRTGKSCSVKIRLPGSTVRIDKAELRVVNCALSYANLTAVHAAQVPGLKPLVFRPVPRSRAGKRAFSAREQKKWDLMNQGLRMIDRAVIAKPEVRKALSTRDVRVLMGAVKAYPSGTDCSWIIPAFAHPGHYRLEFVIEGSSNSSGLFRRQVSRSLAVLPDVDLRKSVVRHQEHPLTGAFTTLIIPQDRFGNLLGPGHADIFAALDHQAGSLSVKDLMNGTYEVRGTLPGGFLKKGAKPVPRPPRFFRGPGFFGGGDGRK